MAPPNPKRPPRPPRPPGTQAPKDSEVELPFDDDEVDPLRADDPRPQRVPQFPAGSRKGRRRSGGARGSADQELLAPRFDWSHEYSDPGHPPAFLYVERGPGTGQLVPVKQGALVLGRSSSADLRLQHPSISRRHAQLLRRADRFFLKDLSSQNGTFLNRTRVTSEVEVKPGDEISMGNALLRLRRPGGTPATGIPAIVTDTDIDVPPRWRPGTFTVALLAAVIGSGLAALVTLVAIHLSGDEETMPPPPVEAAPQAAPPAPPVEVPPQGSAPPAPVDAAGKAPEAEAGQASPATPGMEAGPEASAPAAAGQAEGVAEAVTPDAQQGVAEAGTQDSAPTAAPPVNGPSALDVARAAAKASPRSAAEAAVLRLYEAGEVEAAQKKARSAKLSALQARLNRFAQARAEAARALKKREATRAISQLTLAVSSDEELAPGGSKHGPQLRKQLAELYVKAGTAHARAGRAAEARGAFEQALKYDAGNREALERLGRDVNGALRSMTRSASAGPE